MQVKPLIEKLDSLDKSLTKMTEAFENQDQSDFPYPIDEEDKQGEIEFWPEGGMSTSDFVDMSADYVLDGEIGWIRHIFDAGLETIGTVEKEKNALSIMQDKAMEMIKEYNTDPETDLPSDEMYFKRSSDEEFKKSLLYALRVLAKWVNRL